MSTAQTQKPQVAMMPGVIGILMVVCLLALAVYSPFMIRGEVGYSGGRAIFNGDMFDWLCIPIGFVGMFMTAGFCAISAIALSICTSSACTTNRLLIFPASSRKTLALTDGEAARIDVHPTGSAQLVVDRDLARPMRADTKRPGPRLSPALPYIGIFIGAFFRHGVVLASTLATQAQGSRP